MSTFDNNQWALILGGSSGFGLASAKKLSEQGMSVCVVHRDRRGAMARITPEFDEIRKHGNPFVAINIDALSEEGQGKVLDLLAESMQNSGSVRLLLHSIAFGNLKLIAPQVKKDHAEMVLNSLADRLQIDKTQLEQTVSSLFADDMPELFSLLTTEYSDTLIDDEDMTQTIYSMGTSLLTWTQKLHQRGLFSEDARVIGLTSEGNTMAWRGYTAVSAAKVALESVSRAIALEFAPYGIRSNIIQAGVTDTPALRAIPGSGKMKAVAKLKNPFKRLTTPEDIANVISLLCMDESAWINGSIIRADGGEQIASF